MKNKRGLLGFLFMSFLLAVLLLGLMFYIKIRLGGIEFRTGNIVLRISYEKQENNTIKNNTPINNDILLNDSNINEAIENITEMNDSIIELNETNIAQNTS